MSKTIREILSEPNGKLSFSRTMAGILTISFVIVMLYQLFKTGKIDDIPTNYALLIAGLYGINKFSTKNNL